MSTTTLQFKKLGQALFASVVVLGMCSCTAGPYWMRWMYDGPPPSKDGKPYNELYVRGWKDGCPTGVSATTNSWYKFQYKFQQDPILAQDNVYYKGWRDAYTYCSRYIFEYESPKGLIG